MAVTLPAGWDALSQGGRVLHSKKDRFQHTVWDSPEPMDEVYLVCAQFTEYAVKVGKVDIMALLRSADESLANKYLETTGQYLEMYEKLIGPYPYSKFALVENFWETGYGMPSFTLLGAKIIRFPFILHSSYPHELLHNWWGNSVFVDYETGNWCEGLTVFLADHLIKEQRGQGAAYRKNALQGYTAYAAGKDAEFPLSQFKSRYNALSSSIGYSKSMMLFHMLRQQVGDQKFIAAVQDFYEENKFRRATFADVRKSFEKVTGADFGAFFKQWVTRVGVPEISLSAAKVVEKEGKYILTFTLQQVQQGEAYDLEIPAAIYLQGQKEAVIKKVKLEKKRQDFEFFFDLSPMRIHLDPGFDVARKLHRDEIPPALSKVFGAEKISILLPSKANPEFLVGYRGLANTWGADSSGKIAVKMDNEVEKLPSDRAIWLFGRENIHRAVVAQGITKYNAALSNGNFRVGEKSLALGGNSVVISVKNPRDPARVVVLLSADQVSALPGLGRKLPHYGKYSYLGFVGDEPANHLKGEWQVEDSPMSAKLAPGKVEHVLPKRRPLAELKPLFSAGDMMKHVEYLASEELEGRGNGSKGIIKAAAYIANRFKKAGLKPGADKNSYFQTWYANAGKGGSRAEMRNVIGVLPGSNPEFSGQAVVLCAHYDHLGLGWPDVHKGDEGKIHYGADDNASGVAVLLELAQRLAKGFKPERAIIFAAFCGEESGLLGSKYFVDNLEKLKISENNKKFLRGPGAVSSKSAPGRRRQEIMAVVNLDTVGRFDDKKGKLMVIGGSSAREWRFIFMGIGYTVGIETELITQELDAGDQVSFIEKGIPGIQLFSGPHTDYHRPTDTVDKIIPAGLVKVAAVAREAIVYLSGRKEPLTVSGSPRSKEAKPAPAQGGQRRVRSGVMPDFAYKGQGVKVGAVSPASPAHKAGLKKGDIIIKLGDIPVDNLRRYAAALKAYRPGDAVVIVFTRGGKEHKAEIVLAER